MGLRDINLQRRSLAKPNLTFKTVLEEARATKASNKSAATIQKTWNPQPLQGAATVHQDSMEPEDSTDEDNEIHRLWFERKREIPEPGERLPLCAGCWGNHPRVGRFPGCYLLKMQAEGTHSKGLLHQPTCLVLPVAAYRAAYIPTGISKSAVSKAQEKRKSSHRSKRNTPNDYWAF